MIYKVKMQQEFLVEADSRDIAKLAIIKNPKIALNLSPIEFSCHYHIDQSADPQISVRTKHEEL
jgi:hypothetical protein